MKASSGKPINPELFQPNEDGQGWLVTCLRLVRHPDQHLVVILNHSSRACMFLDLVEGEPARHLHDVLEKCAAVRDVPKWVSVDLGRAVQDRSFREWIVRNHVEHRAAQPIRWIESSLRTQLELSVLLGARAIPDAATLEACRQCLC